MKKQFLINILLLLLLNALVKPFWVLGIDRSVQNMVGSQNYGLYFALFNLTLLFNTFLDMGLTNFNNRSIARNQELFKLFFSRLILTKLFLGIFYMALCLGAAFILHYDSSALKLIGILALNQFLASLLLFLRSNISGLQMYITDSLLSATDRFILIVLCAVVLWSKWLSVQMDIFVFAWLQSISYTFACAIAFIALMRKREKFNLRNTNFFSGELFKKSLPFALLAILMAIYNRIDAVLLERILPNGALQAGIYAQSYRIFDAVNMISVLFAGLLLPMFSNLLANNKDVKSLAILAFSILFTGTAVLSVTLSFFASPVIKALYHEFHASSPVVFIFLIVSIIPVSLSYIFGTLLTADGKLKQLIILALFTILINVSLNILAIPVWGAEGAAVAACISQSFMAVSQIVLCFRYYRFKINLKGFLKYVIFFLVVLSLILAVKNLHVSFGMSLLLVFSTSFILVFLFKIIIISELKEVFLEKSEHS